MAEFSESLLGPSWGLPARTPVPVYPPQLLNEMARHIQYPRGLVADEKDADAALLAYLRQHVPLLIEAVRQANQPPGPSAPRPGR